MLPARLPGRSICSPAPNERVAHTDQALPQALPAGAGAPPAGAAAAAATKTSSKKCVLQPEFPYEAENPELGGCKACDATNTTCTECWVGFSFDASGTCVAVRGSGRPCGEPHV